MLILFITLILTAAVIAGVLYFQILKKRMVAMITRSLNSKLISVSLPRNVEKEQRPDKEIIAPMEQFYSALSSLHMKKERWWMTRQYIVLEMAVPHVGEQISFYVSARNRIMPDIQKQIYAYFPNAQISEVQDYNIFNPTGVSSGCYLKLENSSALPIKTYKEMETDPLRELANSLSKLREVGEGAAIQIVLRPAKKHNRGKGMTIEQLLRSGKSVETATKEVERGILMSVIKALVNPSAKKKDANTAEPPIKVSEELIKLIQNKISKPQFDTNVRLIASAKEYRETQDILRQLQNAFSQFNSPALNQFELIEPTPKNLKKLFFNFSYRMFDEKEKMVLSSEELTGLYHFPNTKLETPRIKESKSKASEPPADLPKEGLILGRNIYRGEERPIYMSKDDRRRHLYIIGQTGTGKSTEIKNLVKQDILNGEGLALIDPHGDLAEDVLGYIPEGRYNDVVVVDPADLSNPIGLNMLEYDPRFPEQKTFIVNELMNIFDKLYDLKQTGGPIFEQYTRNALMLLMEYPEKGFTILEIPRVLADKEFRRSLLATCTNILVKDFWEKEAEKAGGEASLQNLVPYITSKFNVFLGNDYIRPIIAQSKNTINFREIMDRKKILIVNLTKGRLGDVNASLLGMLLVGKILMAAFSRVDIRDENERKDFYLYIDEFQNFATDSISTILSEARKYRLDLIIGHQFIEQLKKEIKDAVFGNVGNMMVFRVGATDAEFLAKQFEPIFDQNDLVTIDNWNAYVKLLINGKTAKPFSIATYPAAKSRHELADSIKKMSAFKYGRERAQVEREIMERLRPEYRPPQTPSSTVS